METLLNRLTTLNYDILGLMLPGFFALQGIGYSVWGMFFVNGCSLPILDNLWRLSTEHTMTFYIGVLTFSYLLGHLLKWVSKTGVWPLSLMGKILKKKVTLQGKEMLEPRFLLFAGCTRPQASHSEKFDSLRRTLEPKLARRVGLDLENSSLRNWDTFYFLAKTLLGQAGGDNLLASYQNKYTFHRSLATLFAALFWISILGSVALALIKAPPSAYVLVGLHSVVAFILLRNFIVSYREFWLLWGDVLIAELAVELGVKKNDL